MPATTPARRLPRAERAIATVFHRRRLLVAGSIAGLVGHQIAEALVPVVIGLVIDRAIAPNDPVALAWTLAALGAVFIGLLLSWRLGELASVRASEFAGRDVRLGLVSRLLSRRGFAVPRSPGELLSIAGTDVDRTAGIVWVLGSGGAQLAAVLTAAVALLAISVPLGILVLVAAPVLVTVMHLVTAPLERRMASEQAAVAAASATASDLLTGLRTIAGLGAEQAAVDRFERVNRRSLDAATRAVSAKAAYVAASLAGSALLLAAIAWAAGAEALAGTISVGELIAVLGLAQFVTWPIGGLAFVTAELATVRASAKRVDGVLAAEPAVDAPPGPGTATSRGAELVLDAVTTPHLAALSAVVPAGSVTAIRVADHLAARELVEVLAGARTPSSGRVLVDGVPLEASAVPVLAPPHEATLFAGTLRDNLELHTTLDDARLDELVRAAALDDVVSGAGGLERPVGERGYSLSGGQRQRVALARALGRDAAVLVLHDPTSAVDAVTEARIAERLPAVRSGRTTVVVAASPALERLADRLVTA
ncbi:ABC transporter transmembrane domain-containing protein [Agromyces sp. NPDC060279]|uniref:ABC transporter transmembrane domain-containing protein n=1 Tax=Agromyces sp. NPDC060279 TaxID=3347092 RepID=UPI00364D0A32